MEKLIVVVKLGLDLYMKGRWYPEETILPAPEKGLPYFCCNLITSGVVDFELYKDGYKVKTRNSTYLFYSDTIENIEEFAKDNGLLEKDVHSSGSIYWTSDFSQLAD